MIHRILLAAVVNKSLSTIEIKVQHPTQEGATAEQINHIERYFLYERSMEGVLNEVGGGGGVA